MQSWCTGIINLPDLCPKIIYFGIDSGTSGNLVFNNYIILLYKKLLYDYRKDAYKIFLSSFQRYLLRIQKIERKIASGKNMLTCHHKNGTIFRRSYQAIDKLILAKAQFKNKLHIRYCSPDTCG